MRAFAAALGLVIALHAQARELAVEVDFQHVGGSLEAAEFDRLLASPALGVEAVYQPLRLVEGVSASRQPTLPFGSRLVPEARTVRLQGQDVQRQGRTLRFAVPALEEGGIAYRLAGVKIEMPLARGPARPQPLRLALLEDPPPDGAHQQGRFWGEGSVELGARLRLRWSDAHGPWLRQPLQCSARIAEQDDDTYRFVPRPVHDGYLGYLGSMATQQTIESQDLPPGLEGWTLTRRNLARTAANGVPIEYISVHAVLRGAVACEHSQSLELVFVSGRLVDYRGSRGSRQCAGAPSGSSQDARWHADGRQRLVNDDLPAQCRAGSWAQALPVETLEALRAQAQLWRRAFRLDR